MTAHDEIKAFLAESRAQDRDCANGRHCTTREPGCVADAEWHVPRCCTCRQDIPR